MGMLKKVILILFILSKINLSLADEEINVYFPWDKENKRLAIEKLLHSKPYDDVNPRWSLDGKMIAFERISREGNSFQQICYFDVTDYDILPIVELKEKTKFVLGEEMSGKTKEGKDLYASYFCWKPLSREKKEYEFLDKAMRELEEAKKKAIKLGIKRDELDKIDQYIYEAEDYKRRKAYDTSLNFVKKALTILNLSIQQFVFSKDFNLYKGIIIGNSKEIFPLVTLENITNTYPDWSKKDEIVFVSGLTGNGDIYLLPQDASQDKMKRLTDNKEIDLYPQWSPDGTKIVYSTYKQGNMDLYILAELDKPKPSHTQLTNLPTFEVFPTWSKNGEKIAFYGVRTQSAEPIADLYVINSDGSSPPRKVAERVLRTEKYGPTWLPSKFGNKIIYISQFRDNIFIIDVDTGRKCRLKIDDKVISDIDCIYYKGKKEETLLIVYSAQYKNGRMRIFIKGIKPEDIPKE
ncbi:MAG: hypothetical protein AB1414_00175 [bacterium]